MTEEVSIDLEPQEGIEQEKPIVDEDTSLDQEAKEQNYKTLDEWVKEGKDPDKWKPKEAYVAYGKLQKSFEEFRNKTEQRLEDQRRFMEMQKQAAIDELMAKRDQAVQYADVEAFKSAQAQIDNFNQPKPVSGKSPEILDWEARNPWASNPSDPRVIDANGFYLAYKASNPNASDREALQYVDARLNVLHPKENPNRNIPTQSENGVRSTAKPSNKLGWSDLSNQELKSWRDYGEQMFKGDKKRFLKAVADSRSK